MLSQSDEKSLLSAHIATVKMELLIQIAHLINAFCSLSILMCKIILIKKQNMYEKSTTKWDLEIKGKNIPTFFSAQLFQI